MRISVSRMVFLIVEMSVLAFILTSTSSLPEYVASNFNGAGEPNSYMSRSNYSVFILVFAVGIPCLVMGGISIGLRSGRRSINIPHKEFWLSPENAPETIRYLNVHLAYLSSLIALFIGYVHWLVMQANSVQPAQLSNSHLFTGMGLMFIGILLWVVLLIIRFGKVPNP